jgi:hypothetical protein
LGLTGPVGPPAPRDGRVIRDRSGALTDGDDEPIWAALAARIAADEQAVLAAAESDAFDENGVDLTMIDWMLGLTPTERLEVLRRNAAALVPFVRDDLRE